MSDIDGNSLLGRKPSVVIPATGPAKAIVEIETSPEAINKKYLDELAFLEEPVTIVVVEPQDEKENNLVQLSINGVNQFIIPGQPITIKRKYVEVLASARQIRYKMVVRLNEYTGATINKMVPKQVLRYNFSVLQDSNPKGFEWLRGLLAA